MSETLRVTLVQYDIIWEDKEQNFQILERLVGGDQNNSDLYILPEMFTTGFTMDPAKVAEEENGQTRKWMHHMSQKMDAAICGSFVFEKGGDYYNRFYFVDPEGRSFSYDKWHLFSYGKETQHYKPGREHLPFSYKGWKIFPFICYDLRFPVWMRNVENVDLYIGVANWPDARINAWDTLLAARAIENQAYMCAVNRIGREPGGLNYVGHSSIIRYDGKRLEFAAQKEALLQARLHKGGLIDFRHRFRFLEDRDHFRLDI